MLDQVLIVARKELLDSLRDVRSLVSSLLYAAMGPGVVLLVSLATRADMRRGGSSAVLIGMMSVFTLVSVFVGGANVAMDAIAGERERRSLPPLLLNPISSFRSTAAGPVSARRFSARLSMCVSWCSAWLGFATTVRVVRHSGRS